MAVTFEGLIRHNKQESLLLVLALAIFTAVVAGIFFSALSGAPSPDVFLSGAAIGSTLAIGGAGVSFFFGDSIVTSISGAHEIAKQDDPVLVNVVEEMAIAAGVPPPKIYIIDDPSPNAFATGRDPQHAIIVVTRGLRDKLNRDELQGVIAHEMSHVKNYDIRLMMLVAVFAGLIVLMADFFSRSMRFGGYSRGRDSDRDSKESSGGLAIVFVIIGLILAVIAPLISKLMQLAVSREREYLADATAVQLSRNPLALISALKKISMDPDQLVSNNRAMQHMFIVNPDPEFRLFDPDKDSAWATHPPLNKRIERLMMITGNMQQPA